MFLSRSLQQCLLLIMMILPTIDIHAVSPLYDNHASWQLARQDGTTLDQAVAKVKKQSGGRILTAETINKNGQRIHRIKVLLPNGHVRIYKVNAE